MSRREPSKLYIDVIVLPDGRIKPAEYDRLPRLRVNARAELVIGLDQVDDPEYDRQRRDSTIRQLDGSGGVAIRLANALFPPPSLKDRKDRPSGYGGHFALVRPDGPICIEYRLGKRPRLKPLSVFLPDLQVTATSLNNACTQLSEHFETDRQSHTYSAFEVVFIKRGAQWVCLKDML